MQIREMELTQCPPEPVTEYNAGEENMYLKGLSGIWYMYKTYPDLSAFGYPDVAAQVSL